MNRRKIDRRPFSRKGLYIYFFTLWKGNIASQNIDKMLQALDSYHFNIWYYRRLSDVCQRKKNILHSELTHEDSGRKCSLYRSDRTIKSKFSKEKPFFYEFLIPFKFFSENSESYRKIIDWSFFLEVCRSKVDGDT